MQIVRARSMGLLCLAWVIGLAGAGSVSAQEILEFPVPTPASAPAGIAAGPDGSLWFAESAGNKIGRITMAGVLTEYPIPTPGSHPSLLGEGPDGALWFTETLGNKIGRITTDGVISEFPV